MNDTNLLQQAIDETDPELVAAEEKAQLQNIKATAPTLSGSAMLALCNISVWEGNKLDKKASDDVTSANHAKANTARVHKSLMGDCEYLKAIKSLRGDVRNNIHYKYTVPWIHNGPALLTTANYFKYRPLMDAADKAFWEAVDAFIDNYQLAVANAQVSLGDMFDANDYPHPEELRRKFKFEVVEIPLGEGADFRLDVAQETIEHLSQGYEKYYTERFNAAMVDVWERLMKPLANMVDRLDYAEHETKKGFKNTLWITCWISLTGWRRPT